MDAKALKEKFKTVLAVTKPFITKLIDEKVIPAAKCYMYSSLQKKKDRVVNSLLKLVDKYNKEENADKKAAHKIGLDLGIETLEAIGNNLIEAANELKKAIS